MQLQKNQLFHNRYILVELMGSGASAEVWKAQDTKAGNLVVALKIYSLSGGNMDSVGLSNFQQEFTTVFNMTHTNLLRPSGYDVFNSCPYLVMQFCENGSANSMVGRINESDLLHFLHDVVAGLEYLHDHNIIHQDIKPDNILVDDNCNFLLTDFGISKQLGAKFGEGPTGGTRAYMAPERYNGSVTKESDIWSLGATAFEMLTGEPPYGEHGGVAQVEGESMQPINKHLQPEVKHLLESMLSKDPNMRPTASQIRRKIELYEETGSWVKNAQRSKIIYAIVALLSLVMCASIYTWDYYRTKVKYYKDYVEVWAVPEGIGRLSSNEMSHREETYRFEYCKHQLVRVSLVNGYGKVIDHSDTEGLRSRFSDAKFYYTADGKVDYKIVYDKCGKELYKMDYDGQLNTVTFRLNDKYGTEMYLPASTTDLTNSSSMIEERSCISRYLLEFDDNGFLKKVNYVGQGNIPRGDADNVYGIEYERDSKGRETVESFLGADGKITCNKIGLATKEFVYDDDDNCIKASYFNTEHKGANDGNGATVYKFDHDKYGNRISQTTWTVDDKPTVLKGTGIYGCRVVYDEHGCETRIENIDKDGKLMFNNSGYCVQVREFDENGFEILTYFLDDKEKKVSAQNGDDAFGIVKTKNNEHGQNLEVAFFDEFDNKIETSLGYHKNVLEYDSLGNEISSKYFDSKGKACKYRGFESESKYKYDEFNRVVEITYYDENGRPCQSGGGSAKLTFEYNRQGAVTKNSFYGINGKLQENSSSYAYVTFEYDESGNEIKRQYFNASGNLCMCKDGWAVINYTYDPKTNFVISYKDYDTKGTLVIENCLRYDSRGNVVKRWALDKNGNLRSNTVVTNSTYDSNNNQTAVWYTNLSGTAVNYPQSTYSKIKYEYDERGNNTVTSYWSTNGSAAAFTDGTHKWVKEYNILDQLIHDVSYSTTGTPIVSKDGFAEQKYEYDMYGHMTIHTIFDGYGKPVNGYDGWQKNTMSYNKRGKITSDVYYDKDGNLVLSKENEYAKATYTYDENGNNIETKYYDKYSKCTRMQSFKYNKQNRQTEILNKDGNGNISEEPLGYAKMTISYEASGVVPIKREWYSKANKLLATSTYNKETQEWSDLSYTAASGSTNYGSYASTGGASNWQSQWYGLANSCPTRLEDGLILQSISISSSYVSMTFKLEYVSKYEMDSNDESSMRSLRGSLYSHYNQYLPGNVSLYITLVDKAGRSI